MHVSHISLGVCATSLIAMQSETSQRVRCRQCAHLIIIALLFVGLVSCNIMELSPVRSSYQPWYLYLSTICYARYQAAKNEMSPVRSSHNISIALCNEVYCYVNAITYSNTWDVASALLSRISRGFCINYTMAFVLITPCPACHYSSF